MNYNLSQTLLPPNAQHLLGCDAFGRDLIRLLIEGALKSGAFSLAATLLATVVSLTFALFWCVAPSSLRLVLERGVVFLLALPSFVIALCVAAVRGPGWSTLMISLFISVFPAFVRLLLVQAKSIQSESYVRASQALGNSLTGMARLHFTKALLPLCGLKIPQLFAQAILAESALSFIGVGAPIGETTWGMILAQGKDYLLEAPHIALASGIPLILTTFALNKWIQFGYDRLFHGKAKHL